MFLGKHFSNPASGHFIKVRDDFMVDAFCNSSNFSDFMNFGSSVFCCQIFDSDTIFIIVRGPWSVSVHLWIIIQCCTVISKFVSPNEHRHTTTMMMILMMPTGGGFIMPYVVFFVRVPHISVVYSLWFFQKELQQINNRKLRHPHMNHNIMQNKSTTGEETVIRES
jgi:hypothetical protein